MESTIPNIGEAITANAPVGESRAAPWTLPVWEPRPGLAFGIGVGVGLDIYTQEVDAEAVLRMGLSPTVAGGEGLLDV